ncbi:hypothetical protein FKW77_005116 [Venturia effusa]|uniref:Uncharacterized protein n=1 Tax=Venturia effusa TaxID=50376 RepID=A0A517L5B1_9PEZI|nr:hypothetical protein FKW77_005116 [Venturia effusa]
MSNSGTRSGPRKLSKAPNRSLSETAEPLLKKTFAATKQAEPSFVPSRRRLSHHYTRNIEADSTPFGDHNRLDSEDSENEHSSDEEHDPAYSIVPSTHRQAFDTVSRHGKFPREHGHSSRRPGHGKETLPVSPPGMEASDQFEEIDPSILKREELVTLVSNLQSQLRQFKSLQRHELAVTAQRRSPAELVNDTKTLRENVSTWADRYFRHDGILSKDTGKRLDSLKVIVEAPEVYIKDSFLRTRLIQARLWDLLQYHVFDDDNKGERKYYGHIWTGGRAKRTWLKDAVTKENEQVDRDMRPLDDVLRPTVNAHPSAWKAYIDWRSSTYNLLVPPDGKMMIDEAELVEQNRIVSGRIWKSLKHFAKPGSSRRARGELRRLVWRSMWLDLDFRQQPAQFEVKRPWLKLLSGSFPFQYFGMLYDPTTMSDHAPLFRSGVSHVAINTAPALFKSHDWSDAVGQEEEVCLLKAQVPPMFMYIQTAEETGHYQKGQEPCTRLLTNTVTMTDRSIRLLETGFDSEGETRLSTNRAYDVTRRPFFDILD